MASKASIANQQSQLQENVHGQIKSFSVTMDEILIPDTKRIGDAHELPQLPIAAPHWSGWPWFCCSHEWPTYCPSCTVVETKPLNRVELSERLQDLIITSLISNHLKCHTRMPGASQGLYLDGEGETDIGVVMAF